MHCTTVRLLHNHKLTKRFGVGNLAAEASRIRQSGYAMCIQQVTQGWQRCCR
jgi:hypothetical protein